MCTKVLNIVSPSIDILKDFPLKLDLLIVLQTY